MPPSPPDRWEGLEVLARGANRVCARDPLNPAPVALSRTQGSYTVTITYPVSDAMIADPTTANTRRTEDGEPCERLMVTALRAPVVLGGSTLSVTASVGGACSPRGMPGFQYEMSGRR